MIKVKNIPSIKDRRNNNVYVKTAEKNSIVPESFAKILTKKMKEK